MDKSPQKQLAGFIAKYTPEIGAAAKEALAKVRKLVPGAVELVYDNYNALAIGFGPSDRRDDIILSVTLYPRWVSLFFTNARDLPDPQKLLKGSGKAIRHVVLEDASTLDSPPVQALIRHAVARASKPLTGPSRIVIKSISAKQRPRPPRGSTAGAARPTQSPPRPATAAGGARRGAPCRRG
jgi:hypothetical protein